MVWSWDQVSDIWLEMEVGFNSPNDPKNFPRIGSPFSFFDLLGSLCFPLTRQKNIIFLLGS